MPEECSRLTSTIDSRTAEQYSRASDHRSSERYASTQRIGDQPFTFIADAQKRMPRRLWFAVAARGGGSGGKIITPQSL